MKISEMAVILCSSVKSDIAAFRSPKMSFRARICPLESNTETPRAFNCLEAALVGAERDRSILRSLVPPSAPLIPASAKMPSAVLSSTVPPERLRAVAPTVRMASPSCATLVFALLAVRAISSPNRVRLSLLASMPRADIASVARSEA